MGRGTSVCVCVIFVDFLATISDIRAIKSVCVGLCVYVTVGRDIYDIVVLV